MDSVKLMKSNNSSKNTLKQDQRVIKALTKQKHYFFTAILGINHLQE